MAKVVRDRVQLSVEEIIGYRAKTKQPKSADLKEFGILHTVNAQLRYVAKAHGIDSAFYKEMERRAISLTSGSGITMGKGLHRNKNGVLVIEETTFVANRIINSRMRKPQITAWRTAAQSVSLKAIKKTFEIETGIKQRKGEKAQDFSKRATSERMTLDMITKAINRLLDNNMIGSDVINDFCYDRIRANQDFIEFMDRLGTKFNVDDVRHQQLLADFISANLIAKPVDERVGIELTSVQKARPTAYEFLELKDGTKIPSEPLTYQKPITTDNSFDTDDKPVIVETPFKKIGGAFDERRAPIFDSNDDDDWFKS